MENKEFCKYSECMFQTYEHNHFDEHTVTFLKWEMTMLKWTSTKDQLPPLDTKIIMCNSKKQMRICSMQYTFKMEDENGYEWFTNEKKLKEEPFLWFPLPEIPDELA